jgi:hypothetical protein
MRPISRSSKPAAMTVDEAVEADRKYFGGVVASPTRSLWQTRSVALGLKFALNWALRDPAAVALGPDPLHLFVVRKPRPMLVIPSEHKRVRKMLLAWLGRAPMTTEVAPAALPTRFACSPKQTTLS